MTIARLSFARRTALEYMVVATKGAPRPRRANAAGVGGRRALRTGRSRRGGHARVAVPARAARAVAAPPERGGHAADPAGRGTARDRAGAARRTVPVPRPGGRGRRVVAVCRRTASPRSWGRRGPARCSAAPRSPARRRSRSSARRRRSTSASGAGPTCSASSTRTDGLRRQLDVRLSARRREHELVALLRRTPLFVARQPAAHPLARARVDAAPVRRGRGGLPDRGGGRRDVRHRRRRDRDQPRAEARAGAAAEDAVARLHRGDFFGEIALVQTAVRTASARRAERRRAARRAQARLRRARRPLGGLPARGPAGRAAAHRHQRRGRARSRARLARQPRRALRRPTGWPSSSRQALGEIGVRVAAPQRLRSGAARRRRARARPPRRRDATRCASATAR